jgi:hypothetical protein
VKVIKITRLTNTLTKCKMTEMTKLNKLGRIAEQIKKFLIKDRKCQYPSIYVRIIIDNAKIFILLA